jgi:hypothetical protein
MNEAAALKAIERIEIHESKLSDWERSFIDSLERWIGGGRKLTEKQIEKIESISERVEGG